MSAVSQNLPPIMSGVQLQARSYGIAVAHMLVPIIFEL